MNLTIEEWMSALGCDSRPTRWRDLYPGVLARFEAEGNV